MNAVQTQALWDLMTATAALWDSVAIMHDAAGWQVCCYRDGHDEPTLNVRNPSLASALTECLPAAVEDGAA